MANVLSQKISKTSGNKASQILFLPKKEYCQVFGFEPGDYFEQTIYSDGSLMLRPIKPIQEVKNV